MKENDADPNPKRNQEAGGNESTQIKRQQSFLLNQPNDQIRRLGQLPRNFSDMFYKEFWGEMSNESQSELSEASDQKDKAVAKKRAVVRVSKNQSTVQKFASKLDKELGQEPRSGRDGSPPGTRMSIQALCRGSCPSETLSLFSECGEIEKSFNENQEANSLLIT